MTPSSDLYSIHTASLSDARAQVEASLGLTLKEHESLYHGGVYYRLGDMGEEHFLVERNLDPLDDEAAELDFAQHSFLLRVNETPRAAQVQTLLQTHGGFTLLRRIPQVE